MQSIEFPEANIKIAEHQEEYQTVHANVQQYEKTNFNVMTACYELTGEEIQEIMLTKKIWYQQLIPMKDSMQPMSLHVIKPPM